LEISTPDIRGIIKGYQKKIGQISIEYLTDFDRIPLKHISCIYLYINQISVDSGQNKKKRGRKIAENSHVLTESNSQISRISTGYQGHSYTGYHELLPLDESNKTTPTTELK